MIASVGRRRAGRARACVAAVFCAALLSGCAAFQEDLSAPVVPMGDFELGFSEVVAPNMQKLLVSRDATEEEWIAAVDEAVERRLGRYSGGAFYHLGISVEGYSLPPPFVPGRSYLALRVTAWRDATQSKLNEEPELILNAIFLESRILTNREETIARLASGSAGLIEDWLREQHAEQGWFGPFDGGETAAVEPADADDPDAPDAPAVGAAIRPQVRPDDLAPPAAAVPGLRPVARGQLDA